MNILLLNSDTSIVANSGFSSTINNIMANYVDLDETSRLIWTCTDCKGICIGLHG